MAYVQASSWAVACEDDFLFCHIYLLFIYCWQVCCGRKVSFFFRYIGGSGREKATCYLERYPFCKFRNEFSLFSCCFFCSAMMDPNNTFRSLFFSFSLDFYHYLVSMLFIIKILWTCEIICEITEELISLISVKQITKG